MNASQAAASILVVDDQRSNRLTLARKLRESGYRAVEAAGGVEALETIVEEAHDLVMLDIDMPDMDGFEVLRRIRQNKNPSDLPVVMVTASHESGQIVKAFQLGANDYVTKPVDVGITLARIATQIELRRAQIALRESEERYALAARGANDGLWDWNLVEQRVYFSPRWNEMLGLEETQVSQAPSVWLDRIHSEDRSRFEAELEAHLQGDATHLETELRMRHDNGSHRWMLCRGLTVRDANGVAKRMAGSLTDITEGKVADALTGLPNRLLFLDRVQRCINQFRRSVNCRFAVLYLDLDKFKLVNDSLGHDAGDELLISVSRRIEGTLRTADSVVARLGGDEFAILVENIEVSSQAERVAQRVIDAIAAPFSLGCGREVFTSTSIGISYPNSACKDAQNLVREADIAMYEAKMQRGSCFRAFDPSMLHQVSARLKLQNELRRAVDGSNFVLHYQPIVQLGSGRTVGFEALVRWQHPERGLIYPGQFIPISEETGLIVPIGRWVLHHACRQLAQWKSQFAGATDLTISVNVSSKQLMQDSLIDDIEVVLDESGLEPADLKLEVTESAIMDHPENGKRLLAAVRQRGVSVGVDDFGTGYSSLASLHRLPLDHLKVDRSFVNKMIQSQEHRAIVSTILTLASSLDLEAIAEGIETDEQRRYLASMGCRFGQGFYFSKPLNQSQVEQELLSRPVPDVLTMM